MQIEDTAIADVKLIIPRRFGDERGWFSETWNKATMSALGLDFDFAQDNHSLSVETGTLRGLHYQAPPHAQAKLVRVARGRVIDIAVDVRPHSPTYLTVVAQELTEAGGEQLEFALVEGMSTFEHPGFESVLVMVIPTWG